MNINPASYRRKKKSLLQTIYEERSGSSSECSTPLTPVLPSLPLEMMDGKEATNEEQPCQIGAGKECVICVCNALEDSPLQIVTNLKTALYNALQLTNTGTPFSTNAFPILPNDFPFLYHALAIRGLVTSDIRRDMAEPAIQMLYRIQHELAVATMSQMLPEPTFTLANHRVPKLETKLAALGTAIRYLGECPIQKKGKTSDGGKMCHRSCRDCSDHYGHEVCTYQYRCDCTHRVKDGCIHFHVAMQEASGCDASGKEAAGKGVRRLKPENTIFVHLSAKVMEKLHVRGMCYDMKEDITLIGDNIFAVRRLYQPDDDDTDSLVIVEKKETVAAAVADGDVQVCTLCPRYRRCPECKICPHMYVCQCFHYQKKNLLCEHCHAVAIYSSKHRDQMLMKPIFEYESDDSDDELVVKELLQREMVADIAAEVNANLSEAEKCSPQSTTEDPQEKQQQEQNAEKKLSISERHCLDLVLANHEISHGIHQNRIEQLSDEVWIVVDKRRENYATVKRNPSMSCMCDTPLISNLSRCVECGICFNDYTCSCITPTPVICKHIHAVHLKLFPSGWERLTWEDRRISTLMFTTMLIQDEAKERNRKLT